MSSVSPSVGRSVRGFESSVGFWAGRFLAALSVLHVNELRQWCEYQTDAEYAERCRSLIKQIYTLMNQASINVSGLMYSRGEGRGEEPVVLVRYPRFARRSLFFTLITPLLGEMLPSRPDVYLHVNALAFPATHRQSNRAAYLR